MKPEFMSTGRFEAGGPAYGSRPAKDPHLTVAMILFFFAFLLVAFPATNNAAEAYDDSAMLMGP